MVPAVRQHLGLHPEGNRHGARREGKDGNLKLSTDDAPNAPAANVLPWADTALLVAGGATGVWDGMRVIRTQSANFDGVISGGWVVAVGVLLIVLALADAVRAWALPAAARNGAGHTLRALAPGLWVAGLLVAFTLALTTLGYFWCTALFMLVYLRGFGRYAWWRCALTALVFAGLSAWLFAAMRVQLPKGLFGWT